MCLVGKLPLVLCSETLKPVSLSPYSRVRNCKEQCGNDGEGGDIIWVTKYEKRPGEENVSFHQYVSRELNLKRKVHEKKLMIPHYTGSIQFCSFPLSESYCYQVFMAYKAWSISNKLTNRCGVSYRTQFQTFISSIQCHKSILLAYERAKRKKCQEDKGIFKHEPTSNVDYNQDMDIEFEGMDKDEAQETMQGPHVQISLPMIFKLLFVISEQ
jgi:hypothetical protein